MEYPEVEVNIMEDAAGLDYIKIDDIKLDHFVDNNTNTNNDSCYNDIFLPTEEDDVKPIPKLVIRRKSPKKKRTKLKKNKNDESSGDESQQEDEEKNTKRKSKILKSPSTMKKRSSAVAPVINDPAGDEKIRMFFNMNCDMCGIHFQTFSDAKTHYKIVHNKAGYITCCDKQYFRRSRALCHISKHLDVKSYLCETCDKGFSSIQSLKHHMDNRHTPNHMKPFKCTMCQKAFMSEPKLARHVSIIHCTEESKKFECNECGKK